jgi:CHAT domain-containing protein
LLVLPLVDTLDSAANLLISPDANLHYIPFHALLDMSSSPSYLLERFTISYVPSATLLSLNAQRESNHEELLLVGYGGDHLLQINEEMAVLGEIFPNAKQLTGERATAERVVETAPNCRLLHLASHARFRPDNVLLSSFALADRQLTLAEISRLRLGAELVTLSGCETGRGRVHGADLVGLASGFLGAGARSLLVSLWRVDDTITALLMSSFYHALCKGSGRAAALREAQLELLSRGRSEPTEYGLCRHPAYWAPFILLGAWDALELNNEEGEIVNA